MRRHAFLAVCVVSMWILAFVAIVFADALIAVMVIFPSAWSSLCLLFLINIDRRIDEAERRMRWK